MLDDLARLVISRYDPSGDCDVVPYEGLSVGYKIEERERWIDGGLGSRPVLGGPELRRYGVGSGSSRTRKSRWLACPEDRIGSSNSARRRLNLSTAGRPNEEEGAREPRERRLVALSSRAPRRVEYPLEKDEAVGSRTLRLGSEDRNGSSSVRARNSAVR